MLSIIWSLLPVPLGIFCIFYGLLSDNTKGDSQNTPTTENTDDALENAFKDPQSFDIYETNYTREDALYYKILMIGLGIGAILFGLDSFLPGLGLIAKGIFLFTVALTITLRLVKDQKTDRNRDTVQKEVASSQNNEAE